MEVLLDANHLKKQLMEKI